MKIKIASLPLTLVLLTAGHARAQSSDAAIDAPADASAIQDASAAGGAGGSGGAGGAGGSGGAPASTPPPPIHFFFNESPGCAFAGGNWRTTAH